MTHKFKIGDKVRVKKDIQTGRYYAAGMSVNMLKYAGKTVTIKTIVPNGYYYIQNDLLNYFWSDDMFEQKITWRERLK